MQPLVLLSFFLLLVLSVSQGRPLYDQLSANQTCIAFSKTLYYADLRPTVRWHVGTLRASADWGVALTSTPPDFAPTLYPEVGLFANASTAVRSVTYESTESLWLSRTRAQSLGGMRELHVAPLTITDPEGLPPHDAQEHPVNGWLFLGPGSALWRSLAGYVMSDYRLALVTDEAYFRSLQLNPRGTDRLVCQPLPAFSRTLLRVHDGACYVYGPEYNIVLDLESTHNYLPSDLFAAWERSGKSALPSIELGTGEKLALVTRAGMPYQLNAYTNEIVLGAPYLRHWDEVAYDARRGEYLLRADTATSNLLLGAEITAFVGFLIAAYLMLLGHSATHFAIPRFVLHYQRKGRGLPTEVGLDGARVRYEVAALVLAVIAAVTTGFLLPDGYTLPYVLLLVFLGLHMAICLYILIRSPTLTRAGLLGRGGAIDTPARSKSAKPESASMVGLPQGTFVYPSLALRDSTQRALARGTNYLMLVYIATLVLTLAIADHALFLLLGTIMTLTIAFAMSYHITGMALFISAMDASAVPPAFAPLWYAYMVVQVGTAVGTVVTGIIYLMWPYAVYASNSYHPDSILQSVVPIAPALLVFGGVLKLHLDLREDIEAEHAKHNKQA